MSQNHKYRCAICAASKTIEGQDGQVYLVPHCDRCKQMMTLWTEDWTYHDNDTDI
jgi:phage FluMu protein Com